MGEAKRRKELNPNYGQRPNVVFSLGNPTLFTLEKDYVLMENKVFVIPSAKTSAEQILVNYESLLELEIYEILARKTIKNGHKIIIRDVYLTSWTISFWANLLRIDFDLLTKDYLGCPQSQLVKLKNKKEQSRQTIEQISDFTLKISPL